MESFFVVPLYYRTLLARLTWRISPTGLLEVLVTKEINILVAPLHIQLERYSKFYPVRYRVIAHLPVHSLPIVYCHAETNIRACASKMPPGHHDYLTKLKPYQAIGPYQAASGWFLDLVHRVVLHLAECCCCCCSYYYYHYNLLAEVF